MTAGTVNYFAHARHFLDTPYLAAGTGVPDWLSAVDRRTRVREKNARQFVRDADRETALVARGILQHIRDDARFHEGRAFAEMSAELTSAARDILQGDKSFRPAFLGHLLVEVLLDATLIAEEPARLDEHYRILGSVDPDRVQRAVNRMAPRPTDRLAVMISEFRRQQILRDYREDGKLLVRLNQVLRRVRFEPLPDRFATLIPQARRLVESRKSELLEGIPT